MSPLQKRPHIANSIVCLIMLLSSLYEVSGIPPVPAINGKGFFIQDYAGIIPPNSSEFRRISEYQEQAFVDHNTPIVIVTIESIKRFGYHPADIEVMAKLWFDQWQIGTQNTTGDNKGILILFIRKERLCRIELGADWGRRFDDHCMKIMKHSMIPYFKSEDYPSGLEHGTKRLLRMATTGPQQAPSALFAINPALVIFGLIGLAIVLMLAIFLWRERETINVMPTFLVLSVIIAVFFSPTIMLPLILYVLLPGLVIYKLIRIKKGLEPKPHFASPAEIWRRFVAKISSWDFWKNLLLSMVENLGKSDSTSFGSYGGGGGGGGFSGGGFSGGGFSGGSSGGGGATGSW